MQILAFRTIGIGVIAVIVGKLRGDCGPEVKGCNAACTAGVFPLAFPRQAVEAAGSFECVWKEWRRFLSDFDIPLVCTCGDCDLKAMLPQQLKLCGIGEGAAVRRWCNVKKCYEKLYGKKAGGMTRMLESLGMDLDGRHHSGIDDSRNIAKLVIRMLQDGAAKGLAPHEVIFATS